MTQGARSLNKVSLLSAMTFVKRGLPMVNHIIRLLAPIGIAVNRSWVKVIITFLSNCNKIREHGGNKFLVIYLKACFVTTQQAAGGQRLSDMSPLGVRFSRTGKGLPTLIPALHRIKIREGQTVYIRFWLTLFSIYRIIEVEPKLNLSSITADSTWNPNEMLPLSAKFLPIFFQKLGLIVGFRNLLMKSLIRTGDGTFRGPLWILPQLKAVPFLIPKSTPSARSFSEDSLSPASTSPAGLILAAKAWLKNESLYLVFSDWCKMTHNQYLLNRIEHWSKVPYSNIEAKGTDALGKIGFKEEAAGKLRNFAMVDPYTQWIFKPLWDLIVNLLSKIPQDGTKDQIKPLNRLMSDRPQGPFYSYDLKAATDRLPVVLQSQIIAHFLGSHAANLWKTLLIGRTYWALPPGYRGDPIPMVYSVGQPMGALTSWGMLALTHHYIVQ